MTAAGFGPNANEWNQEDNFAVSSKHPEIKWPIEEIKTAAAELIVKANSICRQKMPYINIEEFGLSEYQIVWLAYQVEIADRIIDFRCGDKVPTFFNDTPGAKTSTYILGTQPVETKPRDPDPSYSFGTKTFENIFDKPAIVITVVHDKKDHSVHSLIFWVYEVTLQVLNLETQKTNRTIQFARHLYYLFYQTHQGDKTSLRSAVSILRQNYPAALKFIQDELRAY